MYKYLSFILALGLLAGCEESASSHATKNPVALTIIAGSELQDMEPLLSQAQKDLNIKLSIRYTGTIDAVENIKSGANYDLAWLSQSKYFFDTAEGSKRIKLSEKTMTSPVVVGVRSNSYENIQKSARSKNDEPNWADISSWVTQKNFTYAMTDPSVSNTGYIALMGVAYNLTDRGENLRAKDVDKKKMAAFFKGHTITAASSGNLFEPFAKSQADFIISYEASIMQYNKVNPQDKLTIVYPREGIVTADYPLILLDPKKLDIYQQLVTYLKKESSQQWIADNTSRRPLHKKTRDIFPAKMLVEMPFNPSVDLAEELLSAYYTEFKKPSALAFVLDTSTSMAQGTREQDMKTAIANLTVNVPDNARFAQLREREKVYVIPFSSEAYDMKKVDLGINQQNASTGKKAIFDYVSTLRMDGGTAVFSSTLQAMSLLQKDMVIEPDYRYSVIVFTDGVSNQGMSAKQFTREIEALGIKPGQIRVFPILFGEASNEQLKLMAEATGGKVFDAHNKSLSSVFKQIRSYQ